MALVKRFEDLTAWQEARRLTEQVYRRTRSAVFVRDRELASQLRRAALSTVTNIAEGFGSGTKSEFRRFLRYAIRSAAEVQAGLYIALDQHLLPSDDFRRLFESAERLKSLCSALVRRLGQPPTPRDGGGRIAETPGLWAANARLHRASSSRSARPRRTSPRPHVSTPTRQHVSTSTRQHVNTSTRQHVNTSARPHVNTSARPHVGTSARQHVRTS